MSAHSRDGMPVSVRIVSDGTSYGTKVYDVATGEQIKMVSAVALEIKPGQSVNAVITVLRPEIEVVADAEITYQTLGDPVEKVMPTL